MLFGGFSYHSQVVSPFDIRFQANQKGGIKMISNVAITCDNSNGNCAVFQNQLPPNGNHNQDGGITMDYVDIDSDGSTFMSSSDSLSLPPCSEVSWAGLYWSARVQENTVEYVTREQVKIKLNNFFYQSIISDETIDVQNIPSNPSFGMPSYFCFKDITSLVQASGGNGRFTVANVSSRTGSNNLFGAWTIVVVYKNELESLRNLTVFDGMGYVAGQNNLDIPISGFITPQTGPVSFELGATAYEGDRSIQGDRFQFNGSGGFLDVPDPLRTPSDFFNSTITYGGALTPYRNPDFNNLLGFDNGIFIPDNSAFTYIGNGATSATIRVVTTQDAILPRIITSAIDVYQPDLRASVSINDLNGPPAQPGDILEYTVVGKNIGSDVSLDTYMETSLDIRTVYVPNSIEYLNGPFTGAKTDAAGDDQAEYDPADRIVRTRVSTGADALNGGAMVNSPLGTDSAAIKFQVEVIDDCILLLCDTTLENLSFIYGDGEIGGYPYDNAGASAFFDANGCPTATDNIITINAPNCTEIEISSNSPYCEGDSIQLIVPISEYALYSWEGPNGFTSTEPNPIINNITDANAGIYTLSVALIDSSCIYDNITDTIQVLDAPGSIVDSIVNITCNGFNDGLIAISPQGISPFSLSWSINSNDTLISSLSPGDYSLELTDSNGCVDTFTYNVLEPTELVSSTLVLTDFNGFNVSCFADSNGVAEVSYSGGTSPYEVFWSNGDSTDITDSLFAGAYNVLVTDTNNCEVNASVTLIEPTPIVLGTSFVAVSCFGGDDGSIDLSVIGGVPGYSFIWSNGDTLQDTDTLITGEYNVLVTDLNGCTDTLTETITEPTAPLSISEVHINVDCFGNTTGSIDITVAGGTAPYTYLWNTSATTEDLTDLPFGSYTLTVTDSLNCTEVMLVEITQPVAPLEVTLLVTDVSCFGDSTGAIDAAVTGGTFPYTYLWSTTDTTEDLSGLPSASYTITVTDTNACSFDITGTVSQPSDSLFVSLQVTDVDCFGSSTGSILSSVSGGTAPYTYLWSNTGTTPDIVNVLIGTYDLLVTDSLGCSLLILDSIQEPEEIVLTHSQVDVLCFGDSTGSIDLTFSGGVSPFTYLWSNGSVTEDLSSIPAGPYDVVVTDSNGCQSTRIMSISEPLSALALSETHTDALCIGGNQGTIDLTAGGGTPGYTFLWNNNEITEDIIDLVPGVYIGQVTDDHGCIDSISIEILDPSNTMVLSVLETAVSCFEGSDGALDLTVTGGLAPYSFDWSNTELTEDLSGLITGNYFVIVEDSNFCESFISGFIDQPLATLSATDSITSVICHGDSTGAIQVTTAGGTSPYTYAWDNGSVTEDIDSIFAGSYTLVITDENLCTDTNTYIVNEPLALVLGSDLIDATCFGDADGAIDLTPAGGVSPYTYQWSNDSTTQDLDSLIAGDYTLLLTDENLCTASVTLTINEPLAPISVTADSSNISCFGGNDGFIDLTVVGGNGSYSYVWSNAALSEDLTDLFIGTYTVDVQDFKGCTTSLSMTLTQPNAPLSLSVEMTPVICFSEDNGTATVTATGGTAPYTYLWSNTEDSLFIDSLIAGDYSVVVTDSLLCMDTITVTVTEPTLLTAQADSIDVLCHGDSTGTVSVVAQGGVEAYSYLWDTGTADTTTVVDSLPAGTYTVIVTDTNGCFFVTSTTINEPLAPLSSVLDVTNNICFGESLGSIDAIISGGTVPYSYLWSNDSITAYIDSLAVGPYTANGYRFTNACVSDRRYRDCITNALGRSRHRFQCKLLWWQ